MCKEDFTMGDIKICLWLKGLRTRPFALWLCLDENIAHKNYLDPFCIMFTYIIRKRQWFRLKHRLSILQYLHSPLRHELHHNQQLQMTSWNYITVTNWALQLG